MNIDKELIKKALEFYEIDDQNYINKCFECVDNINKNQDVKLKVTEIYNILYKDKNDKVHDLWKIKDKNKLFGNNFHPFITNILVLLGYEIHLDNMQKYGFDEEQIYIHKRRVRECLIADYERGYDGIRISEMIWATYFINCRLIEVGRLQYEKSRYNIITKEKEDCIKIHIPRGKDLNLEQVKTSLRDSKEYIRKYFNLDNPEYYCESWLLSKQIRNMLDDDSNILKFQNLFDIIDSEDGIVDVLHFVYDLGKCNNYSDLKEDTRLQKRIKEFLIKGNSIKLGVGKLKWKI